jgi:hypothetical protein
LPSNDSAMVLIFSIFIIYIILKKSPEEEICETIMEEVIRNPFSL